MDHSTEHHKNVLLKLCRICGKRAQTNKEIKTNRPAELAVTYSDRIWSYYHVGVTNYDENRHPNKICTVCYKRLTNFENGGKCEITYQRAYQIKAFKTLIHWHFENRRQNKECETCELYAYQIIHGGQTTLLKFLDQKRKAKGKI